MRKKYSSTLEAQVVLEMIKEEKTVAQLASEHGIHPTVLQRWRKQALENLPQVFSRNFKLKSAGNREVSLAGEKGLRVE